MSEVNLGPKGRTWQIQSGAVQAGGERRLPGQAARGSDDFLRVQGATPFGARAVLELPSTATGQLAALESATAEMKALYKLRPLAEINREILAHRYPRQELSALLVAQNEAAGAPAAALANARKLADPDTVAVVTGQQVGIFGGPLYSLYKALATINEARALAKQGIHAVPVFWMASYDHDRDEVAKAAVLNGQPEGVLLKMGGVSDQRMIGAQPLGAPIEAVLKKLEEALGDAPHAREVLDQLRAIYRPDQSFAQAFARWWATLLGEHGLVVLDPAGRDFMRLARPVLERELFGAVPSGELIVKATESLTALGFAPQVPPKSEVLNLYLVDDNGKRVAVKRVPGGFESAGTPAKLSDAEMRKLLEESPERLSPGALLRPLVEDCVLPTIGYVGGPAERKYYGQLIGLYDWAELPAPAVMKRPSFYLADGPGLAELCQSTGLSPAELLTDPGIMERIGRAAIPEAIAKAYQALAELRPALHDFDAKVDALTLQGAATVAAKELGELKKRVSLALDDAKRQVRAEGNERLEKGLEAARQKVIGAFESFDAELSKLNGKSGQAPKRALGAIDQGIAALDEQLVKVGRQSRPDLVAMVHRLKPRGEPQEREMNVAQLIAEQGKGIIAELLPLAGVEQRGPGLVLGGAS